MLLVLFSCCFNILYLCLMFVSLISMCLVACFSLGLSCMVLFALLGLIDYFLFHLGENFKYNLFKNLLMPFLFLFFFWDPYNSNVGAFDIFPEVSETIFGSFYSFYFILLFRRYLHHFVFQLTDPFFCFRYPATESF